MNLVYYAHALEGCRWHAACRDNVSHCDACPLRQCRFEYPEAVARPYEPFRERAASDTTLLLMCTVCEAKSQFRIETHFGAWKLTTIDSTRQPRFEKELESRKEGVQDPVHDPWYAISGRGMVIYHECAHFDLQAGLQEMTHRTLSTSG